MNKKNIKAGVITGIICFVFMIVSELLQFGSEFITDSNSERHDMCIAFPIWAICMGCGGYGLSKYFGEQKTLALENHQEDSKEKKELIWKNHKRWIFSNFLNFGYKVTALALPVYLLAYFDNSKYLPSNIIWIVSLIIISIICFILYRYFKKKHLKNSI